MNITLTKGLLGKHVTLEGTMVENGKDYSFKVDAGGDLDRVIRTLQLINQNMRVDETSAMQMDGANIS